MENGPYAEVTGTAAGVAPPSVSKAHTAFTVELPSSDARWVSYTVKTASLYAFYSGPKTRLAVRSASGQAIGAECEGPTEPDACPKLPYQTQVRLGVGTVNIALFPEDDASSTKLVIENVEE